jgi:hypothetical protein
MVRAAQAAGGEAYVRLTRWWDDPGGLSTAEFRRVLEQSDFTLCPRGSPLSSPAALPPTPHNKNTRLALAHQSANLLRLCSPGLLGPRRSVPEALGSWASPVYAEAGRS